MWRSRPDPDECSSGVESVLRERVGDEVLPRARHVIGVGALEGDAAEQIHCVQQADLSRPEMQRVLTEPCGHRKRAATSIAAGGHAWVGRRWRIEVLHLSLIH